MCFKWPPPTAKLKARTYINKTSSTSTKRHVFSINSFSCQTLTACANDKRNGLGACARSHRIICGIGKFKRLILIGINLYAISLPPRATRENLHANTMNFVLCLFFSPLLQIVPSGSPRFDSIIFYVQSKQRFRLGKRWPTHTLKKHKWLSAQSTDRRYIDLCEIVEVLCRGCRAVVLPRTPHAIEFKSNFIFIITSVAMHVRSRR